MSAAPNPPPDAVPAFCEGIQYFADTLPELDRLAGAPLLGLGTPALPDPAGEAAVYQTLLAADALRYLTLQVTGSKSSGHPGGFASSAEAARTPACMRMRTIGPPSSTLLTDTSRSV